MDSIFISIASYRDPDLINTIKDAYEKADNPDNLVFGIVFQGEVDELNDFAKELVGNKVKIKYVPIEKTKGTGWARNILTRDYLTNEDYWLQIDSHMRFKKSWDTELISFYKNIGEECLVSAFPPHFGFNEDYEYYTKERTLNNKSLVIDFTEVFSYRDTKGKIPEGEYEETITASGAFQFASNYVANHLTFDEYYNPWMDQEITSCLAHMNGFKIYAPRKAVLWHCYFDNAIGAETKWRNLVADDMNVTGYDPYPFDTIKKLNTAKSWQSWHDRVMEDINTKKDWI